jgi:hypothetical protein
MQQQANTRRTCTVKFVHNKNQICIVIILTRQLTQNVQRILTNTQLMKWTGPAYCRGGGGPHKTQYLTCISLIFETCTQFNLVHIPGVHKFRRIRSQFKHNEKVHSSFNKIRWKHVFSNVCVCIFLLFFLEQIDKKSISNTSLHSEYWASTESVTQECFNVQSWVQSVQWYWSLLPFEQTMNWVRNC